MIGLPTLRNTTYKPKERNVLDLFTVEGEGGYKENEYTFMFKSSAFFNDDILSTVKGVMADDAKLQKVIFGGQTFNYREGILRIVMGNNNKCIIYRDGSVDIGGKNTKFPELAKIIPQIRDTFCPSSYAENGNQYQQIFLLENGDLLLVNVYTKTITKLLTGVQKFINKNQAHLCDAVVGLKNGDMYQVWVRSPYGGQDTAGVKNLNIKHTDVLFCTMSDPPASATICFKNEPNKLYRFIKGANKDLRITGVNTTPVITLDNGEYFVDGMGGEDNGLYLTNKKIISKYTTAESWGSEWNNSGCWERNLNETPIIKARKIATPTAYSMIIVDSDEKYWLCGKASNCSLKKPVAYTFFDTLRVNLDPIRDSS